MARAVTVQFNSKALDRQLKLAVQRSPAAAAKAVRDIVLHLSSASAKRAPIETGDLRNDCHGTVNGASVFSMQKAAAAPVAPSLKSSGRVGYSLPYALRQHEDLALRHSGPAHGNVDGGEAKYLERPFTENTPRYIARLRKIPDEVVK